MMKKTVLPVSRTPMDIPWSDISTVRTARVRDQGMILVAIAATIKVTISSSCLSKWSNRKPPTSEPRR